MTRMEYDVVALGELLIDFTAQGAGADGYPLMAAHPGGAPANFLAAIARLGGRTALLSKVGADAFGTMLTGTLREVGVDTRGVVVAEDAFTTLAFVTLDAHGERSFSFARKPGADTQLRFEELDLSLIEKTKAFHFGTLSLTDEPARGATQRAVAFAKERGKLITFDPNLRPPLWRSTDGAREQMLWGLGQADVVKLSDNEVKFLFGLSPREGAAYIRERFGTQLVFVTCGADGCEFANPRAQGHVDGLKGLTVGHHGRGRYLRRLRGVEAAPKRQGSRGAGRGGAARHRGICLPRRRTLHRKKRRHLRNHGDAGRGLYGVMGVAQSPTPAWITLPMFHRCATCLAAARRSSGVS